MYNNIAVFIRGHKRIWDYLKLMTFENFEKISRNVDYYVAVWNDGSVDITKLKKDFDNKNLVEFLEGNIFEHFGTPYLSPTWLNYNLLPSKKIREKTVKYDVIFDHRFDLLVFPNDNCSIPIESNTIYSPFVVRDYINYDPQSAHLKDYGWCCDSLTFDKFCERFAEGNDTDLSAEAQCSKFANKLNIRLRHYIFYNILLARPDIGKITEINTPIIFNPWVKEYYDKQPEWDKITKDEKIKICENYQINLEDYIENILTK